MATKLNHETALAQVFRYVSNEMWDKLAQPEQSAKTKKLYKEFKASQLEDYNNSQIIKETLRGVFHAIAKNAASAKKLDETSVYNLFYKDDKVTSLVDTPDRFATYIMSSINSAIENTKVIKKKTGVNVAMVMKFYKIVGDTKKTADYFGLSEDTIKGILNK